MKLIQKSLEGKYQLILFNSEFDLHPIFAGPYVGKDKNITLLYTATPSGGHYEHVKRISAFLKTKYFCLLCSRKAASLRQHYSCASVCRKCLASVEDCKVEQGFSQTCPKCQVLFHSPGCINRHYEEGIQMFVFSIKHLSKLKIAVVFAY